MGDHTPLTIRDAKAVWLRRQPDLHVTAVNYLRNPSLTRPKGRKVEQKVTKSRSSSCGALDLNLSLAREALIASRLAEDIVQEVGRRYFRAVEAGQVWAGAKIEKDKRTGQEKRVTHADCWLSTVLQRTAWETSRREARQYLHRCCNRANGYEDQETPPDAIEVIASAESSPEDLIAIRESLSIVDHMLREFPERDRQMLLMHVCGYSYQDIADELGVTAACARTSVHRTRKALRRKAREMGKP